MDTLFKQILTSSVYEAAIETDLQKSEHLSAQYDNTIFLKREDQQPVFSFKIRGAYNKLANLSEDAKARGVIAASAGNHAQGVAYSATKTGVSALIVMPETTPQIKVDAVKKLGGEVILYGTNYSEAAEHAYKLQQETNREFIHPFDDELVIAGQGTVADEILRQHPGHIHAVFIPIGGGGLAAGMSVYIKTLRPEIKVYGVEPCDSDAMYQSIKNKRITVLPSVGIFADGVAVTKVGEHTFELCRKHLDGIIRVSTDEICSAIKSVYTTTRSVVEPAGALATAGLIKYVRDNNIHDNTLIAVNSGANMNFEKLRFVADRTLVGEHREALYAVTIPETEGSLKKFCLDIVGKRNITEFNYRLKNREQAHIFVGISIASTTEKNEFEIQMSKAGYNHTDLTDNELAKSHVRYMVGGSSDFVTNERIFRFRFPETPGALTKFLDTTRGNRNITLFHYRSVGGDYGQVLVGLEVDPGTEHSLYERLDALGYVYVEETDNPVYGQFL